MSTRKIQLDATFWNKLRFLVFSGGAMNGLAYVGVLQVLEQVHRPLYEQARGFAGCSIGALVSLLLAIGHTSESIGGIIDNFDAATLLSRGDRLFHNMGMADAEETLGCWIGELILNYMGKNDVNFAELFRRTRVELTVVVTNFTQRRTEYWNRHTQPGTSVRLAVTASMALPLVFTPVVGPNGDLFLDGGLGDTFPLHVFPPDETLGVRIRVAPRLPFTNIVDYGMALLDLKETLGKQRRGNPAVEEQAPIIVIPGNVMTGLNFFLPSADRGNLRSRGVQATLVWLLQAPIIVWAWCRLMDIPWFDTHHDSTRDENHIEHLIQTTDEVLSQFTH